jgi:molecular chaperone GrpE (heat shock protein)
MSMRQSGYWARLGAALRGQAPAEAVPAEAAPAAVLDDAAGAARLAGLELDLRERDARIATMQAEYETLRQEGARATEEAGQDQLEALCKRLASPLANLAALRALAAEGKTVSVDDVLALAGDFERALRKAGLEVVGQVGETTIFDVAVHQRMSGGDVHTGTAVTVRLPGYRLEERVVLKAMVSAKGVDDGEGRG